MTSMQHGKPATDPEPGPDKAADSARGRRISPLTVLGVILLAAGLACLGWVGWQYFGTNIVSRQDASKEIATLEESWSATAPSEPETTDDAASAPPTPEPGSAQWLMRIPAFGDEWVWPIVAGVDTSDLARGVGWYSNTSMPGEVGNFAVAGHRITHGEPFRRMLELDAGDAVIVETRDAVLTYELVSAPSELTVQDTETWVLDPVPGHDDQQPSEEIITLTTCEDLFHSPDRSVAFGKLISMESK